MIRIVAYFSIVSMLYACSGKSARYGVQLQVSKTFLQYAAAGDSLGVQRLFGAELNEIGLDKALVNGQVARLHYLLGKYGIPDEEKFEIKEYEAKKPQDVDVTIAIPGDNGAKAATLVVEFVKYYPGKIFKFRLNVEGNEAYPVDKDNIMEGAK